jgi:hypothetical protein
MNPFSTFFDNNPMSQNTPETQAILFKSLVDFIEASKDIHADSTNPFHRNRYASLSAHLLALKPLAAKHGLAIIQMPIGDSESVGVRTLVIHACGAYRLTLLSQQRRDSRDKTQEHSFLIFAATLWLRCLAWLLRMTMQRLTESQRLEVLSRLRTLQRE